MGKWIWEMMHEVEMEGGVGIGILGEDENLEEMRDVRCGIHY